MLLIIMNKYMSLIVLGSALTAGCAIITYKNIPAPVWIQHQVVNEALTAKPGDELLNQSLLVQTDGIEFEQGFAIKGYSFSAGQYKEVEKNKYGTVYEPYNEFPTGGKVSEWGFYQPASEILIDTLDRICVVTYSSTQCVAEHTAKPTKINTIIKKSIRQVLRLVDVEDKKLSVVYQEYLGEATRPRLKKTIELDLTTTHFIDHNGARIQIIEATNESFQYKVLNGFNRTE